MILFPVLFILPLTQLFASGERPNFQDDVAPVFEQSCNSCHNPDKAKGGLDLTGMNGILAGGSSGEVVLPGDAEGSLLYLLTARLEEPHMPPRGERIEQASLDLIKNWIDQGLLPTASGKPMEKKRASVHFSIDSTSLGKPEGPPPMPKYLPKEPVVVTQFQFKQSVSFWPPAQSVRHRCLSDRGLALNRYLNHWVSLSETDSRASVKTCKIISKSAYNTA